MVEIFEELLKIDIICMQFKNKNFKFFYCMYLKNCYLKLFILIVNNVIFGYFKVVNKI